MGWKTDEPKSVEAVAYTRDYSASSVLRDLQSGENLDRFQETPEFINYYSPDGWKVYRVTITIEPVETDPYDR